MMRLIETRTQQSTVEIIVVQSAVKLVHSQLSEGPLVRNVVVRIPKFDAKPNPNPNHNPMPIRQLEPRTTGRTPLNYPPVSQMNNIQQLSSKAPRFERCVFMNVNRGPRQDKNYKKNPNHKTTLKQTNKNTSNTEKNP